LLDARVSAERHIEAPARIESAQSVVPRAVEVIENRRGFFRLGLARRDQLVEARAMRIVQLGAILHRERDPEAALEPSIEIDVVGIDVVENRALGHQAKRDRQAAAQRFDQPRPAGFVPEIANASCQPSLAARPFEGWPERSFFAVRLRRRNRYIHFFEGGAGISFIRAVVSLSYSR